MSNKACPIVYSESCYKNWNRLLEHTIVIYCLILFFVIENMFKVSEIAWFYDRLVREKTGCVSGEDVCVLGRSYGAWLTIGIVNSLNNIKCAVVVNPISQWNTLGEKSLRGRKIETQGWESGPGYYGRIRNHIQKVQNRFEHQDSKFL